MAGSKRTTSTSGRNNKKTSAAKGSRGSSSSTRGNSTRSNAGQNRTNRSGNYSRTSSAAARRREEEQRQEMQRDIILVLLFAGMVFLFLSNFGLFGMVGGAFQSVMMGILGFAAYLLPVVVFALTLYGMMNQGDQGLGARIGCIVGLYVVFAVICELVGGEVNADSTLSLASIYNRCSEDHVGGGVIGGLIAWILMHTVRMAGTVLVLIVVSAICLVFVTRRSILRLMQESAIDARDRVRYRREAEAEYRNNHPDEYVDDGFLPDEEDDELTENDIAAYRRRQQEQARAERQERMREQARRDVERRHENRKEADRIFRGIVGDTDLSNDPWMRQQSAAQEETAAAGSETAAEPIIKEPTVEESAATAQNTNITNTEPVATKTDKVEEVVTTAATAAVTVSAAEQLLRNQRPGTDGIQLAVASAGKGESYASAPEAVQQSVRSAIPIHRESNNMHEINVEAYQGYYASLASGSAMAEEDDEDLTSRIIREGLADLGGNENDRAAEEPAFGGARTAAADAFSRSSFTEIQHAYDADRGNMPVEPVKDIDDIEDGDDEASVEITQPIVEPAQAPVQTSVQESIHTDSSMQELQAPDAEENDAYDVVTLDSDEDEDDDAAERIEPAAPEAVLDPIEDAEDAAYAGSVGTRMGEITTPVGSGSAIAAAHARDAQIHTEATAERTRSAATSAATTASATHAAAQPSAKPAPRKRPHKYVYPTLNLLNAGNPSKDSGSDDELRHTAEVLETTLHTFGVNCKITDISQGPAVTRYELLPEQGVKVSKVVGLSDDIKLALAAMDIRIEAPIPGKSAIGIEVPNKVTSMVALRDILSNPNFRDHKSKLAIGVGKDISGQIVVSDLAKMPHVLIAGATGSGKSVCINTIIMSILYHAAPDEVKLLMIDPKVVELSVYNGIPHLLYPVVTNPQQAATLLNWAVAEMESRYRKFADAGVRDMKGYNQMVQHELDRGNTTDPEGNPYHILPRIVVIVDELADLMMVAKNDVETAICRLAQLARAAGIHLIIATQRPSVDVITGLIKANMPSRIAFAVTSGVDSRTILDMNGAEKLLGKGDMLFFPQGLPKPARIQGAFVSDDEVMEVVSYIKDHNTVDSEEEDAIRSQMEHLGSKPQDGGQGGGGGAQDTGNGMDEYFRRAGKFIIEKDNASIGLLQRGFRIGFNRAARLMDQLCEAGVVAESEGTKSRRILMSEAEFEAFCQQNEIQ